MASATFGHWIKQRRAALHLTQRALAEQADCTTDTIRKLEADRLCPLGRLAERLADALLLPAGTHELLLQFARGSLATLPPALLSRLDQGLSPLNTAMPDGPQQQRTLRGAVAGSYDRLTPPQQALFRRLSVFVGGCSFAAAQEVCGAAGDAPVLDDVLPGLHALIEQHLLLQSTDSTGEPRFSMLETIREHAWERTMAEDEIGAVRRQHAQYFLSFAESWAAQSGHGEQKLELDRIAADYDNLRAALAWSYTPGGDHALGTRLAIALVGFWTVRGFYSEGRDWLSRAAQLGAGDDAFLRSLATAYASRFAWQHGDDEQASAYAEAGLASAQRQHHPRAEAVALNTLGLIATRRGNYAQAASLYEQTLALWRSMGDAKETSDALNQLGHAAHMLGDLGRARALYEQSLRLCRQQNNRRSMIWIFSGLGNIALEQGDVLRARALYLQSYSLAVELGHRMYIASTLNSLGEVERTAEQFSQAIVYLSESVARLRELGSKADLALVLHNLGLAQQRAGRMAQAAASFEEAIGIARVLDLQLPLVYCLAGLASVATDLGRTVQAIRLFSACQALLAALNTPMDELEQRDYSRSFALARDRIDDAAFEAAWAGGRLLTLEQAAGEALNIAALARNSVPKIAV